jgi:hypothetical protein
MSKNSPKQLYIQTMEWLKSRGVKTTSTYQKKSRLSTYNEKERK